MGGSPRDRVKPGGQRPVGAVLGELTVDAYEHLLHQIFGFVRIAGKYERPPEDGGLIPRDQRGESRIVARRSARRELHVESVSRPIAVGWRNGVRLGLHCALVGPVQFHSTANIWLHENALPIGIQLWLSWLIP